MKLIFFNDPHLAAKNPVSRRGNYLQDIETKLEELSDFCIENDCLAFCTGDWSNPIPKYHHTVPLWLIERTRIIFTRFEDRLYTALGNHDWDEVPENFANSWLYYALEMANVKYGLYGGVVASFDGYDVHVVNSDAGRSVDSIRKQVEKHARPNYKRILVVHGPIASSSILLRYPEAVRHIFIEAEQLAGWADYIFYGDIHDPHGSYVIGSTTFTNFGSLARNTAHELNSDRDIGAAFFDTQAPQQGVQFIALENVRPASEAFNALDIVANREKDASLETFVSNLQSTEFAVLTPDTVKLRIKSADDLSDDEKRLALGIIDSVARE